MYYYELRFTLSNQNYIYFSVALSVSQDGRAVQGARLKVHIPCRAQRLRILVLN